MFEDLFPDADRLNLEEMQRRLDEQQAIVLKLTTFLRSLDLFLELIVLTPGTLTANQVRHGGKQGTDNPELSRIHSSACLVLAPRETSGLKINYFFQTNRKMPHQMLNASSSIAPIPTTRTANAR